MKVDVEQVLEALSAHVDGDWNDGLQCYVNASNNGETLFIEVEDGEGNSRKFQLSIEAFSD